MAPGRERCIQTSSGEIRLRAIGDITAATRLVELQREIWGYGRPDTDFPHPARALFAISQSGGHVAAAFLDNLAVGLSLAWIGMEPVSQKPYLHSQLVGVLEEYRHHGIGYYLKLYQRDFALENGMDLVKWTFDPMRSANANLNLRKLGAIIKTYQADYYGKVQSDFSHGLATDRVWAEWHVASERVQRRLANPPPPLDQEPALVQLTNLAEDDEGMQRLVDYQLRQSEPRLLVEVPDDFEAICQRSMSLAQDWQSKIREIFQHYLSRGYTAADFLILSGSPRRAFYLLSSDPLEQLLSC